LTGRAPEKLIVFLQVAYRAQFAQTGSKKLSFLAVKVSSKFLLRQPIYCS